MTKQVWEMLA